jgi:hypothetical protein
VWASADSYLEAFPKMAAQRRHPMVALPPMADFPLGATCGECRVDIRTAGGVRCADCQARFAAGRRIAPRAADDGDDDASENEWVLLKTVNDTLGTRLRPARHLGDLARLGEPDSNRNHLATIAMDGNGIGGFFAALATVGDADLKRQISPAISAATRNALYAATADIVRTRDRTAPVVPHVLGGDDVVVSVVADRAWAFVRGFLAAFDRALADATKAMQLPANARERIPTMSAGLVFGHHKFPYARAIQLAEQMMRRAKHHAQGAEPAICWVDVTTDGEELPTWRRAFTMRELTAQEAALASIVALGNTSRQVLQRLLASGNEEEATAAVLAWARRGGHDTIRTLPGSIPVSDLRGLVALTRWWRP